ncbi:flagellar basal body rod protein FlgC [Limnohabitans sp. MMS-10A-178]|jgi:flagellar basal-body rod protein FlgC|uniref:flagellar basal body rod protein FlgC n=1 Tax=Limnohabitans sp. MMS-10A-178 TaxID=1835767 RepID=UPI000D338E3E|nr:flagellar basal body rod protein FlgC [Limnohabitans sp. MMS-10A-178]MCX7261492.1 flagellar basal body rod protein FlgC [Burkholderiales bacterium]PUE16525.1 flagellar basal body rod protein FlgC [Limnohabitans sp. MMS-10A-178]
MALDRIFNIAGSALNAQTTRMNTTASNLANSGTVTGKENEAFRAKRTVFKTILEQQQKPHEQGFAGGVRIEKITDDPSPIRKMSEPNNPMADKDGYVYLANVNEMTEMVEMMAASRSYQNNVEVVNTTRQMLMRTIDIIKT